MALQLDSRDALVVVDVQNDFLPGGALGIPDGDAVIAPLNRAIAEFRAGQLPIIATRDWHPPDHCSFAARGGPWPPHCVQDTPGAEFAPGLELPDDAHRVLKGTLAEKDAYSGFDGTGLHEWLHERGILRLFVGGLATDYCVKQTVLDACAFGYDVFVLDDAVRAVAERTGNDAFMEMLEAGAHPLANVL